MPRFVSFHCSTPPVRAQKLTSQQDNTATNKMNKTQKILAVITIIVTLGLVLSCSKNEPIENLSNPQQNEQEDNTNPFVGTWTLKSSYEWRKNDTYVSYDLDYKLIITNDNRCILEGRNIMSARTTYTYSETPYIPITETRYDSQRYLYSLIDPNGIVFSQGNYSDNDGIRISNNAEGYLINDDYTLTMKIRVPSPETRHEGTYGNYRYVYYFKWGGEYIEVDFHKQ